MGAPILTPQRVIVFGTYQGEYQLLHISEFLSGLQVGTLYICEMCGTEVGRVVIQASRRTQGSFHIYPVTCRACGGNDSIIFRKGYISHTFAELFPETVQLDRKLLLYEIEEKLKQPNLQPYAPINSLLGNPL